MRGTGFHKAPEISVARIRVKLRLEEYDSQILKYINLKQFVENCSFRGICEYAPAYTSSSGDESDIYMNATFINFYRVAHLLANLGWVELDLGNSLGYGPLL